MMKVSIIQQSDRHFAHAIVKNYKGSVEMLFTEALFVKC